MIAPNHPLDSLKTQKKVAALLGHPLDDNGENT